MMGMSPQGASARFRPVFSPHLDLLGQRDGGIEEHWRFVQKTKQCASFPRGVIRSGGGALRINLARARHAGWGLSQIQPASAFSNTHLLPDLTPQPSWGQSRDPSGVVGWPPWGHSPWLGRHPRLLRGSRLLPPKA